MKSHLIILLSLLLCISCGSYKSAEMWNSQLYQTLIAGLVNEVRVSAQNNNQHHYLLNDSLGRVDYDEVCDCFPITVGSPGEYSFELMSNSVRVESQMFQAHELPTPELEFPGVETDEQIMKLSVAKNLRKLVVKDMLGVEGFQVIAFDFVIMKDFQIYEYGSDSEMLTSRMINLIAESKVGDSILFEEINVQCPDGSTKHLPMVRFKLI